MGRFNDTLASTATTPTASAQPPSVGRMVHYYPMGADIVQPQAAIIAGIEPGERVTLHVFPPDGDSRRERGVAYSEGAQPGAWSWPPRV